MLLRGLKDKCLFCIYNVGKTIQLHLCCVHPSMVLITYIRIKTNKMSFHIRKFHNEAQLDGTYVTRAAALRWSQSSGSLTVAGESGRDRLRNATRHAYHSAPAATGSGGLAAQPRLMALAKFASK